MNKKELIILIKNLGFKEIKNDEKNLLFEKQYKQAEGVFLMDVFKTDFKIEIKNLESRIKIFERKYGGFAGIMGKDEQIFYGYINNEEDFFTIMRILRIK